MNQAGGPGASRAPFVELLVFLRQETAGMQIWIVGATILTGVARGGLLAIFNTAASGVRRTPELWQITSFVLVLLIYLTASYCAGRLNDILTRTLVKRLRLRICERILAAPLRLIELQEPGKIFSHIGHEIEHLGYSAKNFLDSCQSGVVLFFALLYMAWLSLPGLMAGLLVILLSGAVYVWQDKRARLRYQRARDKEAEYFDAVYDLLHGFKELKLGRPQQDDIAYHLETLAHEFRNLGAESARLYRISELTSQTFIFTLIAIYVFGLPVLFPSNATPVYQFLATVLFMLSPAEQLISNIPSFSQAAVALGNIRRLEQALGWEVREASLSVPRGVDEFEKIEFRDVHFEFRGTMAEECFDLGPINLELKRGEILFVCGGNGAGKTTLLKLIAGLYTPSRGTILVNGRALHERDMEQYRGLFAAVFSDVHLLRKLYGIFDPEPSSVQGLLESLQIADKVTLRDRGFSTTRLSAGQRKRLAYATARLRERQIYLFDEFAADQDPGFRAFFYTVLLSNLKQQGKTIVVVTHDDRWFGAADRLVKLEYGRVVANAA